MNLGDLELWYWKLETGDCLETGNCLETGDCLEVWLYDAWTSWGHTDDEKKTISGISGHSLNYNLSHQVWTEVQQGSGVVWHLDDDDVHGLAGGVRCSVERVQHPAVASHHYQLK
jgi:hypothetical protein